jgi:hypothetical protein
MRALPNGGEGVKQFDERDFANAFAHSEKFSKMSCVSAVSIIYPELHAAFLLRKGIANVDLVVSRVGVDVVVFPISLHEYHFICWERFEMLLPLRSISDNGSKARSREQILGRLRISGAAHDQGKNGEDADAAKSGEYMFHGVFFVSCLIWLTTCLTFEY